MISAYWRRTRPLAKLNVSSKLFSLGGCITSKSLYASRVLSACDGLLCSIRFLPSSGLGRTLARKAAYRHSNTHFKIFEKEQLSKLNINLVQFIMNLRPCLSGDKKPYHLR